MSKSPAGPLTGVTVLDLCSYLAGPYGCTLLADLGADVIKIESPQGDMLRQFPSSLPGEARFFLGTNRGKRALALDLKQKEGLAVLHRMVESLLSYSRMQAGAYAWRLSPARIDDLARSLVDDFRERISPHRDKLKFCRTLN